MNPRDRAAAAIEQMANARMARKKVREFLGKMGTLGNPKFEIRMTNQIRNSKFEFQTSNLIRVSNFEFRVSAQRFYFMLTSFPALAER